MATGLNVPSVMQGISEQCVWASVIDSETMSKILALTLNVQLPFFFKRVGMMLNVLQVGAVIALLRTGKALTTTKKCRVGRRPLAHARRHRNEH